MQTAPPFSGSSRRRSPISRRCRRNNLLLGALAAAALLWPSRLAAPLDGIPLDRAGEAILVGVLFPALWLAFPQFLRSRLARALIVALLASKALAGATLVQDGWCARFVPAGPITKDETGAPHSWDLRADWLSADPACSAIVTRTYEGFGDFPAWFYNLPPASDNWPGPADRPPGATTRLTVRGYLDARRPGTLRIDTGRDMTSTVVVDGREIESAGERTAAASVGPGVHAVNIDATLEGTRWQLIPTWNGVDLWSTSLASVKRPSTLDRMVRPWGGWFIAALAATLLGSWLIAALAAIADAAVLGWLVVACGWFGAVAALGRVDLVRWTIPLLAGAVALPVTPRLRNVKGAFVLLGIPWLLLIVVLTAGEIGRFRLYDAGNDYWTFQRAAYRIVMQGYWLEAGSKTFWFQPLYRWFAGLLHMVFGDSSVGEAYWDAALLLVSAIFSFAVVRPFAGFKWAIAAAVLTLSVHVVGRTWPYIGAGLSEITSAGLVYLAATVALHSRHRRWGLAAAAGLAAALAFYTRLNNLPMAVAVAVFALPPRLPARMWTRPGAWIARTSWTTVVAVLSVVALALVLFAWRTWHYTGVFSVTYGTQAKLLAVWQPGMRLPAVLRAMASSAAMVLTMNDPPRFDPLAIPLLAGMAIAVLALVGVPRLRDVPLSLALFAVASISGAFVARGTAYPGRFSIHVVPVTCALVICAISGARRARGPKRSAASGA